MEPNDRHAILEKVVQRLREHFDSVQVIACHREEAQKETTKHQDGFGSIFERYGAVRSWLIAQDKHLSEDDEE